MPPTAESERLIDLDQPLNRNHRLARGLLTWLRALPQHAPALSPVYSLARMPGAVVHDGQPENDTAAAGVPRIALPPGLASFAAFNFAGAGYPRLALPNIEIAQNGSLTLAWWECPTGQSAVNPNRWRVDLDDGSALFVYRGQSVPLSAASTSSSYSNAATQFTSAPTIAASLNTWSFWTLRTSHPARGVASDWSLWVNGEQVTSKTTGAGFSDAAYSGSYFGAGGDSAANSVPTGQAEARLNDGMLWNRYLTPDEIVALYYEARDGWPTLLRRRRVFRALPSIMDAELAAAASATFLSTDVRPRATPVDTLNADLRHAWECQDTGTSLADSVGTATLTLADSPASFNKDGHVNPYAVRSEGHNDGTPGYWNANISRAETAFTICGWAKVENPSPTAAYYSQIVHRIAGAHSLGLNLSTTMSGPARDWGLIADGVQYPQLTTIASDADAVGEWTFWAITADGTSATLRINTDTATYTLAAPIGNITGILLNRSTGGVNLDVDAVRYWSRALTTEELDFLYNSGWGLPLPFPRSLNPASATLSTDTVTGQPLAGYAVAAASATWSSQLQQTPIATAAATFETARVWEPLPNPASATFETDNPQTPVATASATWSSQLQQTPIATAAATWSSQLQQTPIATAAATFETEVVWEAYPTFNVAPASTTWTTDEVTGEPMPGFDVAPASATWSRDGHVTPPIIPGFEIAAEASATFETDDAGDLIHGFTPGTASTTWSTDNAGESDAAFEVGTASTTWATDAPGTLANGFHVYAASATWTSTTIVDSTASTASATWETDDVATPLDVGTASATFETDDVVEILSAASATWTSETVMPTIATTPPTASANWSSARIYRQDFGNVVVAASTLTFLEETTGRLVATVRDEDGNPLSLDAFDVVLATIYDKASKTTLRDASDMANDPHFTLQDGQLVWLLRPYETRLLNGHLLAAGQKQKHTVLLEFGWRAESLGEIWNPFTTTSGSRSVSVRHTAHGLKPRDDVYFVGDPTPTGGLSLNGLYLVDAVTDADNYTVTFETAAAATATSGGRVRFYSRNRVQKAEIAFNSQKADPT